jgi:acetyl-CoA acyltransferase
VLSCFRGYSQGLTSMNEAVIVSAARTAVGKAPNGALRGTRPDELAAAAIAEALRRAPGMSPSEVDDVILGCAMPEGEQGMNVARIASLRAGIPVAASAVTINRFCSSGLQAIAYAAERIMCGFASAMVAGGTESMSLIPMGGHKVAPNPALMDSYPDVYLSTGLVAENHARESGITREEQDAFALRSHQRALAAIEAGRFTDEIVPITARVVEAPGGEVGLKADTTSGPPTWRPALREPQGRPEQGRRAASAGPQLRETTFCVDEGPRRDTSAEALAKLRPAFHGRGSVTAGNSSQISDGAAAVVVTSAAHAREHGLTPMARFVTFATAGVEPERFGVGPVPAIQKALKLAGLTLDQIDLIELNEAFAAQVLACLKALPIDPDRLNVNGGAIALGHPLGCTGARLTTSLLYEMKRRNARYGMVTMCVGGGMGAAGIFERI